MIYSSTRLGFEDKILINQIKTGSTKLILSIISQDPSKYAKAVRHQESKSLATTSMSIIIPEKMQFRPSDIRQRLPDKIKDIHRSQLTRIATHHVKINRIVKAENFNPKNRRGHPKKYESGKISGPQSYYKQSDYETRIDLLLTNRNALELIYESLSKKGFVV